MKRYALAGFVVIAFAGTAVCEPADLSKLPKPQKEHEWLQQLVGNWETDLEIYFEEGKPPLKTTGSDHARAVGGFWVLVDFTCQFMGSPMTGVTTLGYDPDKKKYVGTSLDSMSNHLWNLEGTVDPTGKILTLETEGPCPRLPGKVFKFKHVIELKSKDQKVMTSSMQDENGKWVTAAIINARRK